MVGDLEVEVYWSDLFNCLAYGRLGKGHLRHQGVLDVAWHLTDQPLHAVARFAVVSLLVSLVLHDFAVNVGHFLWNVEFHIDERCCIFLWEVGPELS